MSLLSALKSLCEQQPQALALLASDGRSWTYSELSDAISRIGSGLHARGVRAQDRVAIAYGRSPEFVLALLGCWQAGAVWLPVADLPAERRKTLLEQARPVCVLGPEDIPLSELSGPSLPAHQPAPQDPAYLIFTSGSTGTPKGVLVPHAGITQMLGAQVELFGLNPQSRSLWLLSPLFDASLSDIGTALLSGGTLVIDPQPTRSLEYFYQLLHDAKISYLDLPPAMLSLIEPDALPPSLSSLVIGGEAAEPLQIERWSRQLRLINVYGPTEATVCSSAGVCLPGQASLLGQPLPGVSYRLDGRVPVFGQQGELWISSPGLALGYWQAPELTAERFVSHEGQRWYRSGDRVEYDDRGEYRFLGRLDRQFKHLGRLICPEEIEAVLSRMPEIMRAVVFIHSCGALAAALSAAENYEPPSDNLLQSALSSLPAWMIPSLWIWPEPFPLTASGKPDASQLRHWPLPEQTVSRALSADESLLAGIWEGLLKQPVTSPEADFFALGGSSVQVLTAVALAAEAGLVLTPEAFYRERRLSRLAACQSQDQGLSTETLRASLPPDLSPASLTIRPRAQTLLLTGATGFLGSRLLAELIQQPDQPSVLCLVRAEHQDHAWRRLEQALAPWGIQPDPTRIRPVCGDLSQPELGLANPDCLEAVGSVLHCAAQVDLVRDYASLFAANVQALSAIAALGRPLHYISTLSVLVAADPRPEQIAETDDLSAASQIHGGYAQSKWAAEAWLRRQTLPIWIYRPGLITGDSQRGNSPERDWLRWLISGLLELGCLPDLSKSPLAVDITPVDYAARGIISLMQAPAGTHHIANPQPLLLSQLLHELASWAHLPMLNIQDWLKTARKQLMQNPNPRSSTALLALCRAIDSRHYWHSLDLFQATGFRLASDSTVQRLETEGLFCPVPDSQLLKHYFRHFAGVLNSQPMLYV